MTGGDDNNDGVNDTNNKTQLLISCWGLPITRPTSELMAQCRVRYQQLALSKLPIRMSDHQLLAADRSRFVNYSDGWYSGDDNEVTIMEAELERQKSIDEAARVLKSMSLLPLSEEEKSRADSLRRQQWATPEIVKHVLNSINHPSSSRQVGQLNHAWPFPIRKPRSSSSSSGNNIEDNREVVPNDIAAALAHLSIPPLLNPKELPCIPLVNKYLPSPLVNIIVSYIPRPIIIKVD
jgi:hypothetical protein